MTKISQLSSIGDSLAIGDQFLIRDIDDTGSPNKSVTVSGITRALDLGTAAAPAIAFATDKNTGIYSPGADQVAVATNGTGRLFVDANGTVACMSAQPTDGSIRISNTTTRAPSNKYGIRFADSASETNAAIYAEQASSDNNASALVFGTNDGTGGGVLTSAAERLRITSAGLVGIGTGSPATALQVVGTATFGNGVGGRLQATTDSNLGYIDSLNNTSTQWQPLLQRGTEIQFHTNTAGVTPVEKVRITSAGLVGIGTSAPGAILHTVNTSAGAATVGAFIQNSSLTAGTEVRLGFAPNTNTVADNRYSWIGAINGAGSNDSSLTFATTPGGAGATERARIDSSGRLLVGTSSDSGGALLQINGDRIRVSTAKTPATSGATGAAGEIAWDADYIYVCTAANTWKRVAIATW